GAPGRSSPGVARGGVGAELDVPARDELLEPGGEVRAEVLAVDGELDDGLEVVELVPGVVAAAAEDDAVDAAALARGHPGEGLQGVGQLDLVAAARLGPLEDVEDRRGQDVAADDGEVRGRLLGGGLLDELGDGDDVAVGDAG